jgi:hypothetical protein
MHVRFVLQGKHPDTGMNEGIFRVAYQLQRDKNLPEKEDRELAALLDWFGENLEIPTRFTKSKSKGAHHRATKGVSWLKPSAKEHITKFWALKEILERNAHKVSFIKVQRPGYIVYEDKHQVVAEPFSDIRD